MSKFTMRRLMGGAFKASVCLLALSSTTVASREVLEPVLKKLGNPAAMELFKKNEQVFATGLGFAQWLLELPSKGMYQRVACDIDHGYVRAELTKAAFMDEIVVGELSCQMDYTQVHARGELSFGNASLTEIDATSGVRRTHKVDSTQAHLPKGESIVSLGGAKRVILQKTTMTDEDAVNFAYHMQQACRRTYTATNELYMAGVAVDQEAVRVPESRGYFLEDVFQMKRVNMGKVIAFRKPTKEELRQGVAEHIKASFAKN